MVEILLYSLLQFKHPHLNKEFSKKLVKEVVAASKKHEIDPLVYLGVLGVESNFKLNKINQRSKDYGIAQVNWRNVRKFKMNRRRLTTDLKYSVESGAKILSWFQKNYAHESKWFVRYNCGVNPDCPNWGKSRKYIQNVEKLWIY